jgi:hypothetical protein
LIVTCPRRTSIVAMLPPRVSDNVITRSSSSSVTVNLFCLFLMRFALLLG